jgi:amino acid transporter
LVEVGTEALVVVTLGHATGPPVAFTFRERVFRPVGFNWTERRATLSFDVSGPPRQKGNRMSTSVSEPAMASKGLKGGSLGLIAVIVIGVASTAPGYSLAAGIGGIAGGVGVKAPFIMLFAFVPMACIAAAFYYMNKADPDCGTNFTWGVRAFGPKVGWIAGWGCIVADLVIMPNLAGISGKYLVLLFSESLADNIWLTTALGVLFIAAMCWICWKGIEMSARSQVLLLGTELVVLALFAVIALAKSFGKGITKVAMADDGTDTGTLIEKTYQSVKPSLSWMSPSGVSAKAIIAGLVVAVFAYWGWDTCVSVNEEAKDSSKTPGRAAVLSTFILLAIYLITAYGAVALLGPEFVTDNGDDAIYALGKVALPTIVLKLLTIAVLTSAAASCQTTILPATRTMLSMGSHGAVPQKFARIDPKQLTPDYSTWAFGVVSIIWYLLLVVVSQNTSTDAYSASIAAVGMAIAVYYGLSGISCIVYYRRYLLKSLKNFVLMGLLPGFGGVVLLYVFVKTIWDARNADYGYGTLLGVGTVLLIGTILLLFGIPLMLWCASKLPKFFAYRRDPADTVPDPYSENTLAAPLGTYTKDNRHGR